MAAPLGTHEQSGARAETHGGGDQGRVLGKHKTVQQRDNGLRLVHLLKMYQDTKRKFGGRVETTDVKLPNMVRDHRMQTVHGHLFYTWDRGERGGRVW